MKYVLAAICVSMLSCGGEVVEDSEAGEVAGGALETIEGPSTAGAGGTGGVGGEMTAGAGGAGGAAGAGGASSSAAGSTGSSGSAPPCTQCTAGAACGWPGFNGACDGVLCVVWCPGTAGCEPRPLSSNTCSSSPCAGKECAPP